MFELDQFIGKLRAALAERSRQGLRDIVARAVAEPAGIVKALGAPDKAGVKVLHAAADLTVINLAWGPHQVTFPHNHRMTAVIGMYGGREDNLFWRRAPEGGRFPIEVRGGHALGTGDVTVLGPDIIHSVVNPLGKISAAIHVYDGDFLHVARSMWDAETLAEQPYDISAVARGMSLRD
jgi:predicted metal-dependent enzyme (double-stranded beta helix superfamily)